MIPNHANPNAEVLNVSKKSTDLKLLLSREESLVDKLPNVALLLGTKIFRVMVSKPIDHFMAVPFYKNADV